MELREFYSLFHRWLWLIVLCILLAGGAAFIVSSFMTPTYEASVALRISSPDSQGMSEYTALLAMDAEKLAERVEVQAVRDTELIRITAEHKDPTMAQAIANEIPKVFLAQDQALQTSRYAELKASLSAKIDGLEAEIHQLQAEIASRKAATAAGAELLLLESNLELARANLSTLLKSHGEIELSEAQAGTSVTVAAPARKPDEPIRPRRMMNTLLAVVVGGMLAVGAIFLIEYLDDTIKTPGDVQAVLSMPTLGSVARILARA